VLDRGLAWICFAGSAAISVGAVYLAAEEPSIFRTALALWCGGCVLLSSVVLIRGATLKLADDGFELTGPLSKCKHRWEEVKRFGFTGFGPGKAVCVELYSSTAKKGPLTFLIHALSGFDYGIPTFFFGKSPDDLINLLREWHTGASIERRMEISPREGRGEVPED
jgi:hypothetical protein